VFPRNTRNLVAIEERRYVVLLGVLGVAIAYRDSFPSTFPFPLPYPTPHLQLLTTPAFVGFLWAFGLYSIFIFAYFSEDKFSEWIRVSLRRLAWACLIGYGAYFAYISSALLVSLFLRDLQLVVFLLIAEQGLLIIGIILLEYVLGQRRWLRGFASWFLAGLLGRYATLVRGLFVRVLRSPFGSTRLARKLKRVLPSTLKASRFRRAFSHR
jgi:hypothetical protein